MTTALDSSVLLTIFNGEPGAEKWMKALIEARKEGRLVICDVVYAETAAAFADKSDFEGILDKLGAVLEPITADAAWLAGQTFRAYRRAGGPRQHLIPDFLIAAHARTQAGRLAARDRGYFRTYFPELSLLNPTDH